MTGLAFAVIGLVTVVWISVEVYRCVTRYENDQRRSPRLYAGPRPLPELKDYRRRWKR